MLTINSQEFLKLTNEEKAKTLKKYCSGQREVYRYKQTDFK